MTFTENKNPRITTGYCAGSGDNDYSLLLDGDRIRKDDSSCVTYSDSEYLANYISEFFSKYTLHDKELETVLSYLLTNSFSFSSFCFKKGNATNHIFPTNFYDYLDLATKEHSDTIGYAQDFLIQSHQKLVLLDKIRIVVRQMESSFVNWKYHERVVHNIYKLIVTEPETAIEIGQNMHLLGSILNRLSTFLFWSCRNEFNLMKENGDVKTTTTENYWQGKVEEFTLKKIV